MSIMSLGEIVVNAVFGFSCSLDNFAVGASYGLSHVLVRHSDNVLVAIFNSVGTLLSVGAGDTIAQYLPELVAVFLGNGLLVVLGLYGVWEARKDTSKEKEEDKDDGGKHVGTRSWRVLSHKEALTLALALSISNLAGGVVAGISRMSMWMTTAAAFVFSFLNMWVGFNLGVYLRDALPVGHVNSVAGWLLVALGVYGMVSACL
eukprot:GFYU01006423.1.p1 GENE.GFYU01006423.1~~GFYU01006423.1.p1  ORF type:complete len:204 (-),score=53.40 GFYU01006423.1:191-802(-)